jgi:dTMP kinase
MEQACAHPHGKRGKRRQAPRFILVVAFVVQQRADGPDGHLRQPDLTVWFDVPPEVAAKRLAQARSPDRFEAEPLAFFQRVAHGYAQRCSAEPQRFARIDANAAREAVWQQVQAAFEGKGWLGSGERV